MKRIVVVVAFAALSACGGASQSVETVTPRENFATAQIANSELANTVENFAYTTGRNMPTTGGATFNGTASINVSSGRGDRSFALLGDAELTANFAGGSITGNLDNFVASEKNRNGVTTYYDATGGIDIGGRRSEFGGDGEPQFFTADYRGTVVVGNTNLAFNGDLGGALVGNRVGQPASETAVRGLRASSYGDTVPVGNGERRVEMDIYTLVNN
tara:strand:- start:46915 stop:47559 length:645 start_codon:yes stop_codon:yes gene_type:complete